MKALRPSVVADCSHSCVTEHAVFAPGRVNLIGEHTDYSGGLVLPVAIDLGTTVAWRPLGGRIRVRSVAFADAVEVGTDGSGDPAGWGRYVSAVARLLHDRGRPAAGIDAVVTSMLPVGSGLSSSAALTVSLALALCRAASFDLEPLSWRGSCRRPSASPSACRAD